MNVMTDPTATATGTAEATDKVLLIKAKGGLGNRMLSAVTGLIYADLTGRRPIIDWRDGVYAPLGENAYPLLFDTPLTGDPAAYDARRDVAPAVWAGHLAREPATLIAEFDPTKHSSPTIYRKYCVDLARLDTSEPVAVFWCYLPKMPRLARHLRTDPRFAGKTPDAIFQTYLERYFTPNARVRQEVATFMGALPRPVIGVHIRYTDRKIPLGKVKDALRAQLVKMPGACIFLATDNADVQAEMAAEFDNIHYTPKYLPEAGARLHHRQDTIEKQFEAENAMIDMWALGDCDHLIYSTNSTFSISSALLGGIGPDRRSDVDARNLAVQLKRLFQART